jgi:lactoylglutathione lyase
VGDSRATAAELAAAGATVIAEPVQTPWNSLKARLEAPGGLQLTLFTELGTGGAQGLRPLQLNAQREPVQPH